MKISTLIAFSSALFHVLLLSQYSQARPRTKIVITRSFSSSDTSKLNASFDAWKTFPPCSGSPKYSVHLFLVFSRSLNTSSEVVSIIKNIGSLSEATNGWGDCIAKVIGIGSDIDRSLDIYNPEETRTNPLWVNRPDRKFQRSVHAIQRSADGPYNFMFTMGIDLVPIKRYWLDLLIDEIENSESDFVKFR
mmetsp:Transcript_13121/g.27754  ORF Transcript_13121/g.27754 Transcript_13121/m.27754 type:complete len:191 (-) Transcript_13121:1169-1741(-)